MAWRWATVGLMVVSQWSGTHHATSAETRAVRSESTPSLTPIYRVALPGGGQTLATPAQIELQKWRSEAVAFRAVVTNAWLTGLAPIFAMNKTNQIELRRRPPRGQENFSEPFFFALPLPEEREAAQLNGRWDCRATREGSKPSPVFELAAVGNQVFGRFDQNTDYRFAFITGGSFRSNWLELRVEHIQEAYLLTGHWRDGELRGQWRHSDDSENGTWEASRPRSPLPSNKTVALYEWRRLADSALCYAVEGEPMSSDWERAPRPLCRVWRPRSD
jgi:hypothetical protein